MPAQRSDHLKWSSRLGCINSSIIDVLSILLGTDGSYCGVDFESTGKEWLESQQLSAMHVPYHRWNYLCVLSTGQSHPKYKVNFKDNSQWGQRTARGHAEERAACTQANVHTGKRTQSTSHDHEVWERAKHDVCTISVQNEIGRFTVL